jgi:hypothetical protein
MFLEQFWAEFDHHDKFHPNHNTSSSQLVGLLHTLVHKTFPTSAVHTITSIAKPKWKSEFITKNAELPGVWSLQRRRARAQASLAYLWRTLRIGPSTGRLARSPNSRRLLRTVWPEIWTSARPGVLRAESSAVIIRFQKWIRRTCLSWRYDGTRGLSLRGLSFVLPVCRKRIISLAMAILDTLKWSETAWWVIPAWTIPTARSRSFWRSRGIDHLVEIQIFRMTNCLLLLTAQLMPNSIIANSIMGWIFSVTEQGINCLFCEDKHVSRKHWRKW